MIIEDFTIKNSNGLELNVTNNEPKGYTPYMGGDTSNPTWSEYLDGYYDSFKPHLILIRESIEKMGLVGEKASKCADDLYYVFSDGQKVAFSWRGWGDLMQAIVNKKEGYLEYYV